jgi:hypothetical protein
VSSHQVSYAQKRRSTRIEQTVPVLVQGVGAMREPYQEQVSTLSISCHGCTYQSKHEVLQGETVYLDIRPPANGMVACSSKARVKWAQKLAVKEKAYQIAVELEIAGNIWGIPAPPSDWFPPQLAAAAEPVSNSRELKVVARKETPIAEVAEVRPDRATDIVKRETASPRIPALEQLMVGLGEQIQTVASQAASASLAKEKDRLLEEFRLHLRDEATRAIQMAIASSKDVIVRQAMKDLSESHESAARNNYALWTKKIEHDLETARQHIVTQEMEAGRRLESLAASTIERVQLTTDKTRIEVVDRFVSRLREQVGPMLAEAKDSLQKLETSGAAFKKESETILAGLGTRLESNSRANLARVQQELEKNAAANAAKATETLQRLYHSFEKAAQTSMESLLASGGSQMTGILQARSAEISREFSAGLENYTRNYLETIGKSIAEIPRNMPGSSRK